MGQKNQKEQRKKFIDRTVENIKRAVARYKKDPNNYTVSYEEVTMSMVTFTINPEQFKQKYTGQIRRLDPDRYSTYSSYLLSCRPCNISKMMSVAKAISPEYYEYFYNYVTKECDSVILESWNAKTCDDYVSDIRRASEPNYLERSIIFTKLFMAGYQSYNSLVNILNGENTEKQVSEYLTNMNKTGKISNEENLDMMCSVISNTDVYSMQPDIEDGLYKAGLYSQRYLHKKTVLEILNNTKSAKRKLLEIFTERTRLIRMMHGLHA